MKCYSLVFTAPTPHTCPTPCPHPLPAPSSFDPNRSDMSLDARDIEDDLEDDTKEASSDRPSSTSSSEHGSDSDEDDAQEHDSEDEESDEDKGIHIRIGGPGGLAMPGGLASLLRLHHMLRGGPPGAPRGAGPPSGGSGPVPVPISAEDLMSMLMDPEEMIRHYEDMQLEMAMQASLSTAPEEYREIDMSYENLVNLEDVKCTVTPDKIAKLKSLRFAGVEEGEKAGLVMTDEDRRCVVCKEDYQVGDEQLELPCQHRFHAECVKQWLKDYNHICPTCRSDVP